MPSGGASGSHWLAMHDRWFSHTMAWHRLSSLCRRNNSWVDDIAQGALTLTVRLLSDGQRSVAEIAREVGISRNLSDKWQKEVALHGDACPGSGGQTEPAAELFATAGAWGGCGCTKLEDSNRVARLPNKAGGAFSWDSGGKIFFRQVLIPC